MTVGVMCSESKTTMIYIKNKATSSKSQSIRSDICMGWAAAFTWQGFGSGGLQGWAL